MGDPHHDDHGHDDHGHDDHGHDDHDAHAQHGPDPFIVLPSSQAVAKRDSLAFGVVAFMVLLLVLTVLIKVFA